MKKLLPLTLAALSALASGCVAPQPEQVAHGSDHSSAAELAGFSPGATTSCIRTVGLQGNRSIGGGAILFERSRGQVYVNRTRSGCSFNNNNHTLIFTSTQAQMCSGDAVRIVDTASRTDVDNCILGEFTEYRR